jgi:hypothetical protein
MDQDDRRAMFHDRMRIDGRAYQDTVAGTPWVEFVVGLASALVIIGLPVAACRWAGAPPYSAVAIGAVASVGVHVPTGT